MLALGHAGITIGAALLLSSAPGIITRNSTPHNDSIAAARKPLIQGRSSVFSRLAEMADIRLLAVASLLPDIIDKPLGFLLFAEQLSSGRTFAHTLLFLLLFAAPGVYFFIKKRITWPLVIAFGVLMHLVLDRMWQTPATLFWPLMGFGFEKEAVEDWLPGLLQSLTTSPSIYIPEIVGGAILLWLAVDILRRKSVRAFIRHGIIS